MDRDQFIRKVQEQSKLTDEDIHLISGMKKIIEYFRNLEKEIESPSHIADKMKVGGEYPDYPFVIIELNKNVLTFNRSDKITVTFVSSFKTNYSDKYEHVPVDEIYLDNQQLFSKKHGKALGSTLLDQYLPYLLASPL